MNSNDAYKALIRYGVKARTAYNAVRKAEIQPQTVAPFGHTVNRPRQITVATGDFGFAVTPHW
jgi:hypothetical protein